MVNLEEAKARLLQTAGEIFAEKGFHAATVREICQKAQVNIASVNYYFGDKEGLYVAAVKEAGRSCEAAAALPAWPPGTPPADKLRDFIHAFLTRMVIDREPAWHRLLIMRELVQPTRACAEFVENFVRPNFTVLDQIVRELLPAGVPERKRRLIAFSIIGQCMHYRVARNILTHLLGEEAFAAFTVDRLTDHITTFSLAGLKGGAS